MTITFAPKSKRPHPLIAALRRVSPLGWLGFFIVTTFAVLALFGEPLAPYGYAEQNALAALQAPSEAYLFGTDQLGRDLFSRILAGTRNIFFLAGLSTALALVLGTSGGLLAGYYGGWVDTFIMRIVDVMLAFPALLMALLILSVLGNGVQNLIIGIGIIFAPRVLLVTRSIALNLRGKDYVEAARALGADTPHILFRSILPNALGPLLVEAALRFSYAVLVSASLGFLGLGVQPPSPDWGLLINEGRTYMLIAPWIVIFPSLTIGLLTLGVNLMADGLHNMLGG